MRALIRRTFHWRSVYKCLEIVFFTLAAITILYVAVLYKYGYF